MGRQQLREKPARHSASRDPASGGRNGQKRAREPGTGIDPIARPAELEVGGGYNITRQVGHLLRKAYQAHMAIFQALSSNPQITPMQFAVMCVLKDHGPCSLTVIGRHIVMDLATVRGITERLSQRGLVSYSRDKADRRQVIARLESAGAKVVQQMIPSAQQISEATVERLSVAERVALGYLLEKISNPDGNIASAVGAGDEKT